MEDSPITDNDRRTLRAIVAAGCDRDTAAKALRWTREQLEEAVRNDPQLAGEVLQSEAQAELYHMRNVQSAAKDEKHWRAATWWLDRKTKKEDGRVSLLRKFASLLEQFIERLIRIVQVEVKQEQDRLRLLDRVRELSREVLPAGDSLPQGKEDVEEHHSEPLAEEPPS